MWKRRVFNDLAEYKRFRVLLNADTVTNSPTLFSSRTIDILACGRPVVSNYALSLDQLLGEDTGVFLSNTTEKAAADIRALMQDENLARESGLRGHLAVFKGHTLRRHMLTLINHHLPGIGFPEPKNRLQEHGVSSFPTATVLLLGPGESTRIRNVFQEVFGKGRVNFIKNAPSLCSIADKLSGELTFVARLQDNYTSHFVEAMVSFIPPPLMFH
jgi:hypothetical protein